MPPSDFCGAVGQAMNRQWDPFDWLHVPLQIDGITELSVYCTVSKVLQTYNSRRPLLDAVIQVSLRCEGKNVYERCRISGWIKPILKFLKEGRLRTVPSFWGQIGCLSSLLNQSINVSLHPEC